MQDQTDRSLASPRWALVERGRQWAKANAAPLVGALAVIVLVLATYYPALNIGFWTDDYLFVEAAGRLPVQQYLTLYFDPRVQVTWYRPMQGMQWRLEYSLFHGDASGYHLVQLSYEALNCLLLYLLVARVTTRWRVGFVAAAAYATLAAYSIAVVWIAVPDALASVFYLLAACLWLDYLETGRKLTHWLAFPAVVAALASKEMAATLPALLFLLDIGLARRRASLKDLLQPSALVELVKRYLPFVPILAVYAGLEFTAVTQGVFARDWGYGVGANNLAVLGAYLARMLIPWDLGPAETAVWLLVVLGALIYAIFKREFRVLTLAAAAVLIVLPVVPFLGLNPRYLYMPMMVSAVGIALVVEAGLRTLHSIRLDSRLALAGSAGASLILLFVVLSGSSAANDFAENIAGVARQTRLEFRPLFQAHPTFPDGTFLYFFDQPFTTPNISGMMFLRYGANVTVSGSDIDRRAGLADHPAAYVFYLDGQSAMHEQRVDPSQSVEARPALPASFEKGISLQGFEAAGNAAKRGEALTLVLYWEGSTRIDKDYTVFAHLLDPDGKVVASYDSQPKRGHAPTSAWKPGSLVVDPIVVPIDADARIGSGYRIEIGLYDVATGERLSRLDAQGAPSGTVVDLGTFAVQP